MKRLAPRPETPTSAEAGRRAIDDRGTLYAPTSLSLDAGAFIDDTCPIDYDIADDSTSIVLGDTNSVLNLMLSDQALLKLARSVNRAAHDMLISRGVLDLDQIKST